MSDPVPKRRWFRFSLLTLFVVVTVLCLWLGWQVKIVHQRRAFLDENEKGIRSYTHPDLMDWDSIPAIRRWLGDEPQFWVNVRNHSDVPKAKRLFPEANGKLICGGHP